MLDHDEILSAYKLAAHGVSGHPQNTRPFVLNRERHIFIKTEVESKGWSFFLTLAEAAPGPCGTWKIFLQTPAQIERQVRKFVDEYEVEETSQFWGICRKFRVRAITMEKKETSYGETEATGYFRRAA